VTGEVGSKDGPCRFPFALCLDQAGAASVAANQRLLLAWINEAWTLCREGY
jgi:hypothetical protein